MLSFYPIWTMCALALLMEMGPHKDREKLWPKWELHFTLHSNQLILFKYKCYTANVWKNVILPYFNVAKAKKVRSTQSLTFRHPPFPNLPPKMERIRSSRSTKVVAIQQVATLSFNRLQHWPTFVGQQILHDVEPCFTSKFNRAVFPRKLVWRISSVLSHIA